MDGLCLSQDEGETWVDPDEQLSRVYPWFVAFTVMVPIYFLRPWNVLVSVFHCVRILTRCSSGYFGVGIFPYKKLAAIAVGIMIILVAVRITGDCFSELTESAVDAETYNNIKSIIKSNKQIRQWHKLRTRTVGREVFLDLHILVDPDLNIASAHEIAETLEETLDKQLSRPVNITVHIEPDLAELRK